MPTENQIGPPIGIDPQATGNTSVPMTVFPALHNQYPGSGPQPTNSNSTVGDIIGQALLAQLKSGPGSGNIGTQETPISVQSSGPNPVLIVGGLALLLTFYWLFKKKE